MQGLFSSLGKYDYIPTLTGKNNELEEIFELCFPHSNTSKAYQDLNNNNIVFYNISSFADRIYELLDDYNYLKFTNDNISQPDSTTCNFKIKYNFLDKIKDELKSDLKYIMVASWRYTNSIVKGPKINNSLRTGHQSYIEIFDGIKNQGKGRTDIRKLLQNAGKYINRESMQFPTNMAVTVLPQFLRRYYDMGFLFNENGEATYKADGQLITNDKYKKTNIMNSIFDIGPVLSLLDAKTPFNNPYIKFVHENQKDKYVYADNNKFLQAFIKSPLITGIIDSPSNILSASKVLDLVRTNAEKNNEPTETKAFLETISPEELVVFNQYTIERFTHFMFLSNVEHLQKKFEVNFYADLNEDEETKYWNDRDKRYYTATTSPIIWNTYLAPMITYLSVFPLLRTRCRILEHSADLHIFDNPPFFNRDITNILKTIRIRTLEQLTPNMATYQKVISGLLDYYVNITIPLAILAFHYFANSCKIKFEKNNIRDFFKQYLPAYNFYGYDASYTKICINEKNDIYINNINGIIKNENDYEENIKNNFIQNFYNYFESYTSWIARGEYTHNSNTDIDNNEFSHQTQSNNGLVNSLKLLKEFVMPNQIAQLMELSLDRARWENYQSSKDNYSKNT